VDSADELRPWDKRGDEGTAGGIMNKTARDDHRERLFDPDEENGNTAHQITTQRRFL
jgi:hypothetical protein